MFAISISIFADGLGQGKTCFWNINPTVDPDQFTQVKEGSNPADQRQVKFKFIRNIIIAASSFFNATEFVLTPQSVYRNGHSKMTNLRGGGEGDSQDMVQQVPHAGINRHQLGLVVRHLHSQR